MSEKEFYFARNRDVARKGRETVADLTEEELRQRVAKQRENNKLYSIRSRQRKRARLNSLLLPLQSTELTKYVSRADFVSEIDKLNEIISTMRTQIAVLSSLKRGSIEDIVNLEGKVSEIMNFIHK